MPIKNYKPNTPGTRGMSTLINDEINVLDLVATDYLLIDESSVKKIEEVLN